MPSSVVLGLRVKVTFPCHVQCCHKHAENTGRHPPPGRHALHTSHIRADPTHYQAARTRIVVGSTCSSECMIVVFACRSIFSARTSITL